MPCVHFILDFLRARIRDLPGLILCCRRRTRAQYNYTYYICVCVCVCLINIVREKIVGNNSNLFCTIIIIDE